MRSTRHASAGVSPGTPHVCIRCRIQTQRRAGHTSAPAPAASNAASTKKSGTESIRPAYRSKPSGLPLQIREISVPTNLIQKGDTHDPRPLTDQAYFNELSHESDGHGSRIDCHAAKLSRREESPAKLRRAVEPELPAQKDLRRQRLQREHHEMGRSELDELLQKHVELGQTAGGGGDVHGKVAVGTDKRGESQKAGGMPSHRAKRMDKARRVDDEATRPAVAYNTRFSPATSPPKKSRTLQSPEHRQPRGTLIWPPPPSAAQYSQSRGYHSSRNVFQQVAAAQNSTSQPFTPELMPDPAKWQSPHGIRAQLRQWQEEYGHEQDLKRQDVDDGDDFDALGEASNNLTRLPSAKMAFTNTSAEQEEEEREAMAHFMQAPIDEPTSAELNTRFLNVGDLVEIEFMKSEREPVIAVFVRNTGTLAQFYTMQGRWVHLPEKRIQYSIPGWFRKEDVEPLLQYLPKPEEVESDFDRLMEDAYLRDLNVPRWVASPLVSRMVRFYEETKEIYRRHAATLDNAHDLMAHSTNLRYGTLVSAATTLLKLPANEVPLTALYAVRQALSNAGFAFNIDRRSHRLTGYLQIRSKEQVRMVEQVRRWLREWQDDLATLASKTSKQQRERHRSSQGAWYVYNFLAKAKAIVQRSRLDRQPTPSNIGPSKVRLPITSKQQCVRSTMEEEFNDSDVELVRFIEAWSLSQMFAGVPRIEALPPLLLQATGLYEDFELVTQTGLLFLQELGTVMPYENRIRFDQHLLLPASQHSKPLQHLMTTLEDMSDKQNPFVDSMADLRHDWGELPVYCIDDAGAHEIDDGISIEDAGVGADGGKESWLHVHIANPTAFFDRNHALAKMARHMGESIYMPERTYMMLPRWATQKYFSLAPGRPCLTFSARVDAKGQIVDRKIRPGRVRNVFRLTPAEVKELIGVNDDSNFPETVLIVGGDSPEPKHRVSRVTNMDARHVEDLKLLRALSEQRSNIRAAAGGLFFDTHKPSVDVWTAHNRMGLDWDHPYRRGSRRVEGDPVIRVRTRGLQNWFSPFADAVGTTVREAMLVACEVAATWCADRAVPAIFRGSVQRAGKMDSEAFYRDILAPAAKESPKGEYPMHLGTRYLETFGSTEFRTKPFKHKVLGMPAYGKVTSPLRRYGDMIVHWQIEAALREEARIGRSLVNADPKPERSFLPFSTPVLKNLLIGLQPRETMILKAKRYADDFWIMMLLFRAHHFGEITLPFPQVWDEKTGRMRSVVRAYVHVPSQASLPSVACMIMELNVIASMTSGALANAGVGSEAKMGDVWECMIGEVDCFRRNVLLMPMRLLERVEE
ncbi:hypothetical protein B0A50_01724 [Salinomyces thailandicus]|uniref:RNB domain-containing protein n=1 Tax=Salinomyces thailandicus TaxID=706561 RepID=A0A4U0U997_9PEZI|nr:hypothetical protein B0A50_01724 [Salinomyces thailandica]